MPPGGLVSRAAVGGGLGLVCGADLVIEVVLGTIHLGPAVVGARPLCVPSVGRSRADGRSHTARRVTGGFGAAPLPGVPRTSPASGLGASPILKGPTNRSDWRTRGGHHSGRIPVAIREADSEGIPFRKVLRISPYFAAALSIGHLQLRQGREPIGWHTTRAQLDSGPVRGAMSTIQSEPDLHRNRGCFGARVSSVQAPAVPCPAFAPTAATKDRLRVFPGRRALPLMSHSPNALDSLTARSNSAALGWDPRFPAIRQAALQVGVVLGV